MPTLLGESLVERGVITQEQLDEGLQRQQISGGRLGDNLVALGHLDEEGARQLFKQIPPPPRSVEDTQLGLAFIVDLVVKHLSLLGECSISEVVGSTKLTLSVVDEALRNLRRDRMVEVRGSGVTSELGYRFALTERGKTRAQTLLELSRYVGPAPVVLREYRSMVETQTIKSILVSEDTVSNAFSHVVIKPEVLRRLGPAVSSGRAMFIYGPPGNGKTTIAETIGGILPGTVYLPYSVLVRGEIITLFDQISHVVVEPEVSPEMVDQRWILVRRPVVRAGGELTLKTLDLDFNPVNRFYEAPLQMKANNGLLIVDDFGRQLVDPHILLNRWIVPLERRADYLTLHTGMKFEIPFDLLVVFATNIEPKELVDEAFLRRMPYKIRVEHPDVLQYKAIFQLVCESNGIDFNEEAFEFLLYNCYREMEVNLSACHPRDLVQHVIESSRYFGVQPELNRESITHAWESYFVDL
jgi:hypothetical protein